MSEQITKTVEFSSEHKQMCYLVSSRMLWAASAIVKVKVLDNNHYPILGKMDDILDTVSDLGNMIDEYEDLIREHELVNIDDLPFNAGWA